jgi:hypothetical protein
MSQFVIYFLTMVTGHIISTGYAQGFDSAAQLTDVFVGKLMRQANTLRLVLDRFPVHNSVFELFDNGLMNGVTLVLDQLGLRHICVWYSRSPQPYTRWFSTQQEQCNQASCP